MEKEKVLQTIREELQHFEPIELDKMKSVKLTNRIDTKYVIPLAKLMPLLEAAEGDYYVQWIGQKRTSSYRTLYLDTADHRMYTIHETGDQPRQKVGIRHYVETDDTFLEVKNKNNHGRTKKKRIELGSLANISDYHQLLTPEAADFVQQKSWFTLDQLDAQMENHFERITLVNKGFTERLTIDLDVHFHNRETERDADIGHIVIIELKREGATYSPMYNLLRQMHILPSGFSKYCIGCALTNGSLRRNNFKEKLMRLEKMRRAN